MNKIKAMKTMNEILTNHKYIFLRQSLSIDKWHLTFKLDSIIYELQMTIDFEDTYVDILCFPHPTLLSQESANYIASLKTVNFLNWCVKGNGRFYIDDFLDLAYSLRIDYNTLYFLSHESAKQIESAIDYFSDIFQPLLNVCQGTASYLESRKHIETKWELR